MAETLPRLRMDLDFMPSPVQDRPGLMLRDPYHYSDSVLIIPPALVECLQFFNGESTDLDLRSALFAITGDLRTGELASNMRKTLAEAGFLEDDLYVQLKARRHAEFAAAAEREPAHAGAAYPGEPNAVARMLASCFDGAVPAREPLVAIAAPHVSIEGGGRTYGAAYAALRPELRDRTFVILGTSHYGAPEKFGLTRKRFVTPLGAAVTDTALVDELERGAGAAVRMEDYCHAVEHSIEFQVVFLQHLFGPQVRILPVLCGPYARSVYEGGRPEDDDGVRRFLGALGEIAACESGRLLWVLGVDMAHIGRRYGDPYAAHARAGRMAEVEETDRRRIARLEAGDAAGFWDAVQENRDDLKWCGSAPFYTFLKAAPHVRGELLNYDQWNIDEHSVVSFAAMAFTGGCDQAPVLL